jgi:uncharacterized membrane protein (DUF4010 family)
MTPAGTEWEGTVRLAIAALIGLGVGLEREWSGHATGPNARFAGLRTFFLLGILGGGAGLLLGGGAPVAGAAVIAGAMALIVAAYALTVRRLDADVDGTTEAAALVVVLLGALAGTGWLALAAGAGSIVVLALSEKTRLHWLVRRVSEHELRAALTFAVLALVILPLLPAGPFGGALAVRPRAIWTIALFFSALNFGGFLAKRAVGPSAGYIITGLLGGLISSTAVTLGFSRRSRQEPDLGGALAYGAIGACTVLIPRVIVVSSVLNPGVGLRLSMLLAAPVVAGALLLVMGHRRERDVAPAAAAEPGKESPLRLRLAIQMSLAFQLAVTLIALVHERWGTLGLYPMAALLGLTDVDALTVSMSRVDGDVPVIVAAGAIAVGILANTLFKLGLVVTIGSGRFRRLAVIGLMVLAAATAAGVLFVTLHA